MATISEVTLTVLQYFNGILLPKCNVKLRSRGIVKWDHSTCKVIFRNNNTSVVNLL